MTTRSRAGERRLQLWITEGIIMTIPSVAVAVAVAPVGLLPVDESTAVSQTLVDPVLGVLLAAAPNARDQGATDRSADVLATNVDGVGGVLLSAAPNSADQGAADHSLEVLTTGVDAIGGFLLSASPSAPSQGATDYGSLVSQFTVDAVAGTLLGAPSFFPVGHIMPALSVWGLLLLVALLSVLALLFIRRVASPRQI